MAPGFAQQRRHVVLIPGRRPAARQNDIRHACRRCVQAACSQGGAVIRHAAPGPPATCPICARNQRGQHRPVGIIISGPPLLPWPPDRHQLVPGRQITATRNASRAPVPAPTPVSRQQGQDPQAVRRRPLHGQRSRSACPDVFACLARVSAPALIGPLNCDRCSVPDSDVLLQAPPCPRPRASAAPVNTRSGVDRAARWGIRGHGTGRQRALPPTSAQPMHARPPAPRQSRTHPPPCSAAADCARRCYDRIRQPAHAPGHPPRATVLRVPSTGPQTGAPIQSRARPHPPASSRSPAGRAKQSLLQQQAAQAVSQPLSQQPPPGQRRRSSPLLVSPLPAASGTSRSLRPITASLRADIWRATSRTCACGP